MHDRTSRPGGAEVLEQRRAEGTGKSVCGFARWRHDRYQEEWCLGVSGQVPAGVLFWSGVAGPGGGSAAQVMSWAVLPVFLPFLLVVLVLARMAVVRGAGSQLDPAHPVGRLVARWPGIIARFGSGHKAGPSTSSSR